MSRGPLAGDVASTLNSNLYDNAESFRGIGVPNAAAGSRPGRFSIVSLPSPDDPGASYRFGATAQLAALRETSVLFGAAIAVVFLKEELRPGRVVAALMIVAGLTLIRLY